MNNMKNKIMLIFLVILSSSIYAQGIDTVKGVMLDNNANKIIPDKLLEIGIPLLVLFLVLNIIVTVWKNREENKLKLRAIEKGVSEQTLIQLFKESQMISKLQPLKMFLLCGALGVSLLLLTLLKDLVVKSGGYLAIGIILVSVATAFYIYYTILNNKLK